MRFFLRFAANTVAVYLALYLVDSVAGGRFLVNAVWVAVLLALVLGFVNSFIRPLHRVRTRTSRALVVVVLTLILNALILQVFAWVTPLSTVNLGWTVAVAVFVTVLTGGINYLVGFTPQTKGRSSTGIVRTREARPGERGAGGGSRADRPRQRHPSAKQPHSSQQRPGARRPPTR